MHGQGYCWLLSAEPLGFEVISCCEERCYKHLMLSDTCIDTAFLPRFKKSQARSGYVLSRFSTGRFKILLAFIFWCAPLCCREKTGLHGNSCLGFPWGTRMCRFPTSPGNAAQNWEGGSSMTACVSELQANSADMWLCLEGSGPAFSHLPEWPLRSSCHCDPTLLFWNPEEIGLVLVPHPSAPTWLICHLTHYISLVFPAEVSFLSRSLSRNYWNSH